MKKHKRLEKEKSVDSVTKHLERRLAERCKERGGQSQCDYRRSVEVNGVRLAFQLTVFWDCYRLLVLRQTDGALLATLQSRAELVYGFPARATTRRRWKLPSASGVDVWPTELECGAIAEVFRRWPDTEWLTTETQPVSAVVQPQRDLGAVHCSNDNLAVAS